MHEIVIEIDGVVPETVRCALKHDLTIGADLAREAERAASMYGYYAVLSEKATARLRRTELSFKMWRVHEEDAIEDELKALGRRVTVKLVDRWLMKKEKYRGYELLMIRLKCESGILYAIARAFEHKKDLIQTLNANRRREIS